MPPITLAPNVLSWAVELDDVTRLQAEKLARLWILDGPVALMPDAHLGKGATVGAVIATKDAVIPAAVGVDIGCGMIAVMTSLLAKDLPDTLLPLLNDIEGEIPAGLGKWHQEGSDEAWDWLRNLSNWPSDRVDAKMLAKAASQLGTLGSGNHFFEVSLDETDLVWVVLHSGSRGIGNQLAQLHIKAAQKLMKVAQVPLEDVDLAYFTKGMPEYHDYMTDLFFAQRYAAKNRDMMMDAGLRTLFKRVGHGQELTRINCHHNYTAIEHHHGRDKIITRKGAICAREGDMGVIPGSMGGLSYIVRGLGNPSSYQSCAHGAGRRLSRTKAKAQITPEDLAFAMAGKTWLSDRAKSLIDEAPGAYKDIDAVMAAQSDLVEPVHTLRQVLNYKGV